MGMCQERPLGIAQLWLPPLAALGLEKHGQRPRAPMEAATPGPQEAIHVGTSRLYGSRGDISAHTPWGVRWPCCC